MSVWHVDRHCGYPEDFYSSRFSYVKIGHHLFLPHPLQFIINPLNPELNSICYLLALLAHHFLHVSRIIVKSLTLRLLMSYIYIYIYDISSLRVNCHQIARRDVFRVTDSVVK